MPSRFSAFALIVLAVGTAAADQKAAGPPAIDTSMPDIPIVPNLDPPRAQPAKPAAQAPDAKPQPPAKGPASKPGNSDYQGGFGDKASYTPGAEHNKLAAEIEKQLAEMNTLPSGKRAADDYFVIGTVEVLMDHHVNVTFEIVHGIKETAAKVADFLMRKEKALVRKWDSFARTKSMAAAQKQLAVAKSKSIEARVAAIPMTKKGARNRPMTPSSWARPTSACPIVMRTCASASSWASRRWRSSFSTTSWPLPGTCSANGISSTA